MLFTLTLIGQVTTPSFGEQMQYPRQRTALEAVLFIYRQSMEDQQLALKNKVARPEKAKGTDNTSVK